MNDQEKSLGERLAVVEEAVSNLSKQLETWMGQCDRDFADLKSLANPRFKTVDELQEWKRVHERAEDERDRKLGRYIAFGFGIMTTTLAIVQIVIAIAK